MDLNQHTRIQDIMSHPLVNSEAAVLKRQYYRATLKNCTNMQYLMQKANIGMRWIKMALFTDMVIVMMEKLTGAVIHPKIEASQYLKRFRGGSNR
ncbi:hypothetical protein M568_19680 [Salmonella enterica subsp. enterica serovar Namur str. 05-2929]|nr:hypothetical protein M568_19680 [Salmonella enterica subsp. enterica serovar Namur str. 05-2929]